MKKILFILLLLPSLVFANYNKQELLNIARIEGKRIGLPNTVQGMLLQESNAGGYGRIHDDGTTFGVMCIKISTARDVTKSKESDSTIRSNLINDDKYNLKVAVKYLEYLLNLFGGDVGKAILAYNVGLGRVRLYGLRFDPNNYLYNVYAKIKLGKGYYSLTNNKKYVMM